MRVRFWNRMPSDGAVGTAAHPTGRGPGDGCSAMAESATAEARRESPTATGCGRDLRHGRCRWWRCCRRHRWHRRCAGWLLGIGGTQQPAGREGVDSIVHPFSIVSELVEIVGVPPAHRQPRRQRDQSGRCRSSRRNTTAGHRRLLDAAPPSANRPAMEARSAHHAVSWPRL